jgi:hypothetical protein
VLSSLSARVCSSIGIIFCDNNYGRVILVSTSFIFLSYSTCKETARKAMHQENWIPRAATTSRVISDPFVLMSHRDAFYGKLRWLYGPGGKPPPHPALLFNMDETFLTFVREGKVTFAPIDATTVTIKQE